MSDAALEAIYQRHLSYPERAITAHLPRLRDLAAGCDLVVEFGVKRGGSSSALLLGAERVISYDVVLTREAEALAVVAGSRWSYRIQSSLEAEPVRCDLLFVDSLHTYAQMAAELTRHADLVSRYLVCHDTTTFGCVGADGETGRQSWPYQPGVSVPAAHYGIRLAIDELMIRDPSWRIRAHYPDSHGLLVLERE